MTAKFGIGARQVACSFLILGAVSFIAAGYGLIAVPLEAEFKPSRMVLMLAMTVMSAIGAVLAPFFGSLMDRISLRTIMIVGSFFLSAGYAALSFATSFNQVLIIFAMLLAPANVLLGPVAATVLLSRWFVKQRGRAIGIAVSGIAMGSVVYPPILQLLLDNYEWREAMRLLALVLLAGTLPVALLVVNSPTDRGLYADGGTDPIPGPTGSGSVPPASVKAILSDPSFWLLAAIVATVVAGIKGMITNLAPFAIDLGVRPRDAALLISVYGISGFAAKLVFAVLADRVGTRTLMIIGLVGFTAGMTTFSQATSYGMLVIAVAVTGTLGGLMMPMQSFLVPRIFGERVVGRAMGLLSMVTLVVMLCSPPFFGFIFDATGKYTAVFLTFAVLAALSAVMVPYLRLQPRSDAEPQEAAVPAEYPSAR